MERLSMVVFLPFVLLQQMLIGGSMGEEPGWRGFALPRLQAHQSSFRASLLLGALRGVWHVPQWLAKGHPLQETFLLWPMLGLMAGVLDSGLAGAWRAHSERCGYDLHQSQCA